MNPDTKLLLKEIQKLQVAQAATQKKLEEQGELLEHRFVDADAKLETRFQEAEAAVEQRILDSELRQDNRLSIVETAVGDLQEWRQEHEGALDDIRLRVTKLDKYWDRSMKEVAVAVLEPAVLTDPQVKLEQHAASPSARYLDARPSGHGKDAHYREDEYGVVTTFTHSPVTVMNLAPDDPPRPHGTAADLLASRNRPPDPQFHPTGKLSKLSFPSFDGKDLRL